MPQSLQCESMRQAARAWTLEDWACTLVLLTIESIGNQAGVSELIWMEPVWGYLAERDHILHWKILHAQAQTPSCFLRPLVSWFQRNEHKSMVELTRNGNPGIDYSQQHTEKCRIVINPQRPLPIHPDTETQAYCQKSNSRKHHTYRNNAWYIAVRIVFV